MPLVALVLCSCRNIGIPCRHHIYPIPLFVSPSAGGLGADFAMTGSPSWRAVFKAARQELAPARKLELCLQCRQLIQERMTELAPEFSEGERATLEEALRALWIMEEEIRNPKIN